jgi:hypothetical protein
LISEAQAVAPKLAGGGVRLPQPCCFRFQIRGVISVTIRVDATHKAEDID